MTAAKSDKISFIIPVSGPGVSVAEQEIYRVGAESKFAGYDELDIKKAVLVRRLLIDAVLSSPSYEKINSKDCAVLGKGPWNELSTIIYSEGLISSAEQLEQLIKIIIEINQESWSKYIGSHQAVPLLQSIPPEAFPAIKMQLESSLLFDPAEQLAKIKVPVLAIFGDKDTSVPVEKSVKAYKKAIHRSGNNDLTIKIFPEADHTICIAGDEHPDFYPFMIKWLRALN